MRICGSAGLRIFKRVKCGWFWGFVFADVIGKMRMRTQYYKLKKHTHFVEIFIVGITLCAIYVRHKTSHRRKSWVNPQNLYWVDDNDVRPPQNSAHIMYWTTRYAVYLYLFAQGIMYYIAFNTGSYMIESPRMTSWVTKSTGKCYFPSIRTEIKC